MSSFCCSACNFLTPSIFSSCEIAEYCRFGQKLLKSGSKNTFAFSRALKWEQEYVSFLSHFTRVNRSYDKMQLPVEPERLLLSLFYC